MKFVALVSGGKDSIFSIIEAQNQGHELVACVHLARPVEEGEEESYMYQTAGSEAVRILVEECLQVPLIWHVRKGKSVQTSMIYQEQQSESVSGTAAAAVQDEVEDLHAALQQAIDQFPCVQAVASGALLSTYQRVRIEHVCQRLHLTSLSYLWRRGSQHDTLRAMLAAGMEVVLVRTAAPPGLQPRRHLNKSLAQLEPTLYRLYDQYRMHVCGEGGEYESLCLFAPGLYQKRLVLDQVEICIDDSDDDVGVLWIQACHAEALEEGSNTTNNMRPLEGVEPRHKDNQHSKPTISIPADSQSTSVWSPPPDWWLPHVCRREGGFWHASAIMSPKCYLPTENFSEAQLAVHEARDILYILKNLLDVYMCTPQDVGMVHLYLADMSHFQFINQYYQSCFGILLPPSRSCVALGNLPQNRRVMLDCWVLAGSGEYMRRQGVEKDNAVPFSSPYAEAASVDTSIVYRNVLHVQSLSHWAPVCVGPYSQANTLLSSLHFLAGSIGLQPASMTLKDTWTSQLDQSWTNLASILDALDQSSLTQHLLSGLVYLSDHLLEGNSGDETIQEIVEISRRLILCNANIVPGLIDDIVTGSKQEDYGGYEDEETRIELDGTIELDDHSPLCPLLVIGIPAVPVKAQVEVEIVAATSAAVKCLPISDYHGVLEQAANETQKMKKTAWDAANDFNGWPDSPIGESSKVLWSLRCLGFPGTGFATVVVEVGGHSQDLEIILGRMTKALSIACAKTSSSVPIQSLVSIRLYYVAVHKVNSDTVVVDMASRLESALASVLPEDVKPAVTIVPVSDMYYLDVERTKRPVKTRIAFQACFLDVPSLRTELWIRQGRPRDI